MGYLTGKGSSSFLKVKANLPLLLTASVLPDVDLFLRFFVHRGPTHSLVTMTVLMIPFFIVYKKRTIPYFAALLSHSLIGDFFTGGVQLFWPFSQGWFGVFNINVRSIANVSVELILFVITLAVILKLGDLKSLLRPGNYNSVLVIAFVAVLGPMLYVGHGVEEALPILLIAPSLFYLGLFSYSMIVEFRDKIGRHGERRGSAFPVVLQE